MKNIARYSGIVGIVFMLFGGLGFFGVTGMGRNLVVTQFFLGLALLIFFLSFYLGDTVAKISERREAIFGVLGSVFLFLILIGINVVSNSKMGEQKFDLTTNKMHSLSAETTEILKNLKAPIEIYAFFGPGVREAELLRNLVEKYTYISSKISFREVDPDREPALTQEMDAGPNEIIVRNTLTQKQLKLTALTEEGLTLTIRRVMSELTKVAYFLQGHGEGELEGEKPSGLYVAKILLENEGFTVKPLNLAEVSAVPADASVVAAWGAQRPLSSDVASRLLYYVERGGHLIIGQDPLIAPTKDRLLKSGLEPIMDRVGLQFAPAILLEYQVQLFRGRVINPKLSLSSFENHPVTTGLGQQGIVEVYFAQAIEEKASAPQNKRAAATLQKLASTSPESWAEKDLKSIFLSKTPNPTGDTAGPLAVAYSAELAVDDSVKDRLSPRGKIVVFGDADFATTQFIQGAYNRDLFLNAFNYVTGEEASLTIRPKTWSSSTLELTPSQKRFVNFAAVSFIPQLILLIAGLVWISRRQII